MRSRGFTLVELVLVMVLIGILAAYAAPRFNGGSFDVEVARRELMEAFRYAQEMSMTHTGQQPFEVKIKDVGDGFEVRQNGAVIADPYGGNYDRTWNGITVNHEGIVFTFDGRGAPNAGGDFTLTLGTATATVTLWAVTGYVQ